MDLAVPVLTEPVSQQSVAVVAHYLFQQAGAGAATALSTVLSVTMTQIVSTLASSLGGAWHPSHTQSALHCTAL